MILDVARCYLWLFTLYINVHIRSSFSVIRSGAGSSVAERGAPPSRFTCARAEAHARTGGVMEQTELYKQPDIQGHCYYILRRCETNSNFVYFLCVVFLRDKLLTCYHFRCSYPRARYINIKISKNSCLMLD